MNKITLETFSENNRDKIIGHSLYRICKDFKTNRWYIHESYNDKNTWAGNNAYHDNDLERVLNIFNEITREKEIVKLRFDTI